MGIIITIVIELVGIVLVLVGQLMLILVLILELMLVLIHVLMLVLKCYCDKVSENHVLVILLVLFWCFLVIDVGTRVVDGVGILVYVQMLQKEMCWCLF